MANWQVAAQNELEVKYYLSQHPGASFTDLKSVVKYDFTLNNVLKRLSKKGQIYEGLNRDKNRPGYFVKSTYQNDVDRIMITAFQHAQQNTALFKTLIENANASTELVLGLLVQDQMRIILESIKTMLEKPQLVEGITLLNMRELQLKFAIAYKRLLKDPGRAIEICTKEIEALEKDAQEAKQSLQSV